MSFLDRIMDSMHLGGDDYDDYDDFDDDYEEEEPVKKSRIFKKKDKDFDYDEDDGSAKDTKPAKSKASAPRITPMRSKKSGNGMEVCVFKPTLFDEAREITDTLLNNCTVVLNFEGLDVEIAQRIIDFTSGSCYSMGGNLRKVSNYIFIVTPRNVDLAGDFQEIVAGAFDVPSI
ncbi:MAG: cell division protein SepF [Lachnospiraceae bacterium]|nr:cell division protein SepF [Lachnospiraceae bacterium]MCD8363127.1 cell division protein SepF [Lachnospiraceae bacterium]